MTGPHAGVSRAPESWWLLLVCLGAALIVIDASAQGSRSIALAIAGSSNATPSVAASGRFVAVTWGASADKTGTEIVSALSRDGGRTFAAPVRVSDGMGRASLSGEQPPRVALVSRAGQEPSEVVVWTDKRGERTRLLSARSDDGGKSFSSPTPVAGGDAGGNRGWEATAVDGNGRVVVVWLDHRELAAGAGAPMNHAAHDSGGAHAAAAGAQNDGVARAQLSKLFFARVGDASSAKAIAAGVCYCCKTGLATGADGAIVAVWRHVYPGNIRDIAFTVSRDGGRTFAPPSRVSEDRWVLDGCPENGPAVAVDPAKRVHIVWPTLLPGAAGSEPTLALFYATSTDGVRFSPRQRVPTEGVPRHPQIALDGHGAVILSWDEAVSGSGRRVALARQSGARGATPQFARLDVGTGTQATYPVIAGTDTGAVVAWTAADGSAGPTVIRVQPLE